MNNSNKNALGATTENTKERSDSPLGSNYKSSSIKKLNLTKQNSYLYQDTLRKVIHDCHEQGSSHRLCSCGVAPVQQFMKLQSTDDRNTMSFDSPISLKRDKSGASFGGLMSCDNPWYCPVCAPKALGDKCNEIQTITTNFLNESAQNTCLMITQTLSHTKDDVLKPLLSDLVKANGYLKSGNFRKKLEKEFGFYSAIRAVESTHSRINGWHPHLHEIWYFKKSLTVDDVIKLHKMLFDKYLHKLELMGKSASKQRGIDISFVTGNGENEKKYSTATNMPKDTKQVINSSSSAARYIAKFDKELTMDFTKIQKLENVSFFGILARYTERHNLADRDLIIEFVTSIKGQRRLNVPKQMKIYLIEEIETLDETENNRPTIYNFTADEWKQICFRKLRQTIITFCLNKEKTDLQCTEFVQELLKLPIVQIPPDEYKFLSSRRVRDPEEWHWIYAA